jgi:transcriptional regulator with XRE-family HTH domain
MSDEDDKGQSGSLVDTLVKLTGQVAGGTVELARSTATMSAMFGESRLRKTLLNKLEPERLEAMAEAGHFLRDARETAGMSMKDLSESLGMSDNTMLEEVESGESILPLELMLRSASLLARHDPIPFLIKFMRTYNPALEKRLEAWGVLALPKQYERERRFINIYRQHDILRSLTDNEFERFVRYMDSSTQLVLDLMLKEKEANAPRKARASQPKAKSTGKPKRKPAAKSTSSRAKAAASRKAKSAGK